mmetsp:Transcript_18131/g.23502  ORF Transcript_18131/g.23502 Transcript_18131/m.23502 type:complete len:90 (+) Transcript_18131:333-602(+)
MEQGKIYYSQATKNGVEDSDALRIELIEEVRHNPSTTRRHLNEKRNDERIELIQNARKEEPSHAKIILKKEYLYLPQFYTKMIHWRSKT